MCNGGLTHMEVCTKYQMCTTRSIFQQLLDIRAHVWLPLLFILKRYRLVLCWWKGGGDERYDHTVWPWHSDFGFALVSPENGLKLLPQSVLHMSKTTPESGLIRSLQLSHHYTDCSNKVWCVCLHVFSWVHLAVHTALTQTTSTDVRTLNIRSCWLIFCQYSYLKLE